MDIVHTPTSPPSSSPIGIFDSGIGGLTVVRSVRGLLPNESILYVGDTARVPYGIKSEQAIRRYAREITQFLTSQGVKLVLIACNTVSAYALDDVVEEAQGIPVIDVLSAGVHAATSGAASDASHRIGVMGTLATIQSGAYARAILERLPGATVPSIACPMLVPLAEEGWTDNEIARLTLAHYLDGFGDKALDRLILGCTHYPLFKGVLQSLMAAEHPGLEIIDSGIAIAGISRDRLQAQRMLNPGRADGPRTQGDPASGSFRCVVSDRPQRFRELAERFLGEPLDDVELVRFPVA